jgi:dTDP-4-dehydrorhamnose 3,5-epimerase
MEASSISQLFLDDGLPIDGAYTYKRQIYDDNRGKFSTLFAGKNLEQLQINTSFSKKGVFRGFHYSVGHPETKYVTAINGIIVDYILDIRKESRTYGRVAGVYLSEDLGICIPSGCAHGFCAVTDATIVYATTKVWVQDEDRGYNLYSKSIYDQVFTEPMNNLIISDRDRNLPHFFV